MKLLEYQAKEIFRKYGIPVPKSRVAKTQEEAEEAARFIGSPVAVKAQLPVGGRGKAGGIVFADNPAETGEAAKHMLGNRIKGIMIEELLVEEKLDINDEVYLGVVLDRSSRTYAFLASSEGGINIEDVAAVSPEKIVKHLVDPLIGLKSYHALWIAKQLGYQGRDMNALSSIIQRLYKVAFEMDAELTEINPLAVTDAGFIAADARLNVDNNALYRHPDISEYLQSQSTEFTHRELQAAEKGLTYVELDGDIGVISNGAGLTMATLDTVNLLGGRAANFLDLGGGASPERIERAVSFVLEDERVNVLLVNILGGITRCDDTARGIINASESLKNEKPIVVRMMGTNEEEGRKLLQAAGIDLLDTMDEAAKMAVKLSEVK